jgi:hypothetical protein
MFSASCETYSLAHCLPLGSNVRTERFKSSRGFDVAPISVLLPVESSEVVGGHFPGNGPDECRDARGWFVCVYWVAAAHGCACARTPLGGCTFNLVTVPFGAQRCDYFLVFDGNAWHWGLEKTITDKILRLITAGRLGRSMLRPYMTLIELKVAERRRQDDGATGAVDSCAL